MNTNKSLIKGIFKIIAILAEITLIIAGINYIIEIISKQKRPKEIKGEYYFWRLGKIFYVKHGQGSPILIIHGLEPSSSQQEILEKAEKLAENHTVYTMDLLGFGESDKPWIEYTNYIYVLLINDFIKEIIKEENCEVIAYEGSCLCALQAHTLREEKGSLKLIKPYTNRAFHFSTRFVLKLKKLIELPIIGTFLYNVFYLGGNFRFDAESKYVLLSRLSGHLETDISSYLERLNKKVEILH